MFPGKLLNFELNRAVCSAIPKQNSCIYCLLVGSRFGLVCRSYKSATRDLCRYQTYYNRQRKSYKTHRYMQWRLMVKMAGKAAKFNLWLNIQDCPLPLAVNNGVSSHSSSPKLIKLVIFSCLY